MEDKEFGRFGRFGKFDYSDFSIVSFVFYWLAGLEDVFKLITA